MRRLYRWWKGRQITKRFMAQFARERLEQLTAEAEAGPLYTADEIGTLLGVVDPLDPIR